MDKNLELELEKVGRQMALEDLEGALTIGVEKEYIDITVDKLERIIILKQTISDKSNFATRFCLLMNLIIEECRKKSYISVDVAHGVKIIHLTDVTDELCEKLAK